MNMPNGAQAELPNQDHQHYVRALEVFAEVAGTIVEEKARLSDRSILEQAEAITYDHALERAVDEAEEITYDMGVRQVGALIGLAEWLVDSVAPIHVHEEAESITHDHSERKLWAFGRPQRPNDIGIEDIATGSRLVVYNDERGENMQELARHEVIVSEPYIKQTKKGGLFIAVKAREVRDHETDQIPLGSEEGVREVPLSAWGITPNPKGLCSQTKFAEPFVGQTKPLQVPVRQESAEAGSETEVVPA